MNDEIIKFKKGKTLIMIAEGDPLEKVMKASKDSKASKTDKDIDVDNYTEPNDDKVKEAIESLQADGIEDLYLYCRKTTTSSNYNKKKLDKASYTEGLDRGIDIGLDLGAKEQKHSIAKAMYNDGVPLNKIVKYTGLTLEEIDDLVSLK